MNYQLTRSLLRTLHLVPLMTQFALSQDADMTPVGRQKLPIQSCLYCFFSSSRWRKIQACRGLNCRALLMHFMQKYLSFSIFLYPFFLSSSILRFYCFFSPYFFFYLLGIPAGSLTICAYDSNVLLCHSRLGEPSCILGMSIREFLSLRFPLLLCFFHFSSPLSFISPFAATVFSLSFIFFLNSSIFFGSLWMTVIRMSCKPTVRSVVFLVSFYWLTPFPFSILLFVWSFYVVLPFS